MSEAAVSESEANGQTDVMLLKPVVGARHKASLKRPPLLRSGKHMEAQELLFKSKAFSSRDRVHEPVSQDMPPCGWALACGCFQRQASPLSKTPSGFTFLVELFGATVCFKRTCQACMFLKNVLCSASQL